MSGVKGSFDKVCIMCECGVNICGRSQRHAQSLLKQHKKAKLHKKQLEGNIINQKQKEGVNKNNK